MNRTHLKWLEGELPGLVGQGILTAQTAEDLRRHYADVPGGGGRRTLLVVCGMLGAALVGLGTILLLAYNWHAFPRTGRTVLTFALLIGAQVIAGWVVWARRESVAWREGASTFLVLALAGAMALVHQTYQIPGEIGEFLLTWMLLCLPLVYLLKATLPALLYLAATLSWAGGAPGLPGGTLYLWLLAALALPHMLLTGREDPGSQRLVFLSWASAVWLCIAVGITIARGPGYPGFPVFCSLFAAMYLAGGRADDQPLPSWRRPFVGLGAAGVCVISFLLTYEWPWQSFVRKPYLVWSGLDRLSLVPHAFLTIGLPLLAVLLLVNKAWRRRGAGLILGLAPILAFAGIVLARTEALLPRILFNTYFFLLGLGTVIAGVRRARPGTANLGLLLLAALIIARFFDSEISFLLRAIAFIVVGLGFLLANLFLIRKGKGGAR